MVGVVAPQCISRIETSSALETKPKPEAMPSSQYQGLPREVRGGSTDKGGDINSGHTCLSGITGPELRRIRDHLAFSLTAHSIACTPRSATGKATTKLYP